MVLREDACHLEQAEERAEGQVAVLDEAALWGEFERRQPEGIAQELGVVFEDDLPARSTRSRLGEEADDALLAGPTPQPNFELLHLRPRFMTGRSRASSSAIDAARRGWRMPVKSPSRSRAKAMRRRLSSETFPFLAGLLQDPEPSVVASAVHALGHLDAVDLDELPRLIHHPSDDVRWALASCLGARAGPDGIEALIELSTDVDVSVRDWATFGLASRGDACVLPYLVRELQRESVGRLAVDAAGQLGDRRLLPSLRALEARCPGDADVQHAIALCE